jgi:hypothetical protein
MMEPLTILIAVAGIVATGALSKIGENITDKAVLKSRQLFATIERKLPETASALAKVEQQPVDYGQAYLEIREVVQKDIELSQLLQEMRSLVLADPMLTAWVEEELSRASPELTKTVENWQGINIKGGTNTITGNTFNF